MIIHSNNRQIVIRGADGIGFQAALSHVEGEGKHSVVITTTEAHRERLRQQATLIARLLCQQHRVKPAQLTYFEGGQRGEVFQVELTSRTPKRGKEPQGEETARPETKVQIKEIKKQMGSVSLPKVTSSAALAEIAAQITQEARQTVQESFTQGANRTEPSRTQRPRYSRPR